MLLDYVARFETVQFGIVFGIGVWGVIFLILHSNGKSELLKSHDQRQKDAIATQISIGRTLPPQSGKKSGE